MSLARGETRSVLGLSLERRIEAIGRLNRSGAREADDFDPAFADRKKHLLSSSSIDKWHRHTSPKVCTLILGKCVYNGVKVFFCFLIFFSLPTHQARVSSVANQPLA